jgi:hypothetical protein
MMDCWLDDDYGEFISSNPAVMPTNLAFAVDLAATQRSRSTPQDRRGIEKVHVKSVPQLARTLHKTPLTQVLLNKVANPRDAEAILRDLDELFVGERSLRFWCQFAACLISLGIHALRCNIIRISRRGSASSR